MDKCASVNIYENLEFCPGETTLPGLRPEMYGIPKKSIVTYPKRPRPGDKDATMAKIATLEGDFGLAADARFITIDILDTASSLQSASQGDKPSKTFLVTLTFKYAGNNEEATGFAQMVNSDDMLFVVRQRDGKYRVVGNDMFETNTKPTQESGMSVTDASGTTMETTVTDIGPAPFYVGKLITDKGVIDCATGEITEAGE